MPRHALTPHAVTLLLTSTTTAHPLQCQAAGTDDLASVRHLALMVDTTDQPATLIGEELPNLVSLDLSGSVLSSLRDLGTDLRSLQVLTVSHCGLRDLEGLSSFPALQELHAPNNAVSDLSPLGMASSSSLRLVDLANNDIRDEIALMQLGGCDSLQQLTLEGNPFVSAHLGSPDGEEAYRATVTTFLPGLFKLDGRRLPGAPSSPGAGAGSPIAAALGGGSVVGASASFLDSGGSSFLRPTSALGAGGAGGLDGSGSTGAPLAGGLAAASFRRRRLGSHPSTGGGVDAQGSTGSFGAARETLHSAGSLSLGGDSFDALPSPLSRGGVRPRSGLASRGGEGGSSGLPGVAGGGRPGSASAHGSWVAAAEGWDDETAVPGTSGGGSSSSSGGGANFLARLAARSGSFGGSSAGEAGGSGSILAVLEAGKAEDARVRRENAAATARRVAATKAAAAEAAEAAEAAAVRASPQKGSGVSAGGNGSSSGGGDVSPATSAAPPRAPAPPASSSSPPSSSLPPCPAAGVPWERLVAMLRERPKNVPELHSREAFRRFFAGFPRPRMQRLLAEAYAGVDEAGEKVTKRLALVDDLLTPHE